LRAQHGDHGGDAEPERPPPARESLGLLADRSFGPFFFGNLIANCGTWFLVLAAGLFVYRLTGSAFLLGVVGFAQFAGVLLLAPWTGTAADRFDRRRLLFVAQGAATALASVLAALVMLDHATTATVIVFVLLIGLAQAFTVPALQAILPDLVAPERLGGAIALLAVTFNLARGAGPAAAALVIATAGIEWAFVVTALAYLALVAGVLAIHPRTQPKRPRRPRFRESIAVVRDRPRLAALMLVSSALSIGIDPVNTLSPAFAAAVWDRSDVLAGVLLGAFSVGALTAAFTVAGRPGQPRRQLVGRISLLVGGMVAFALAPTLELGVCALVVAGFGFLAASTATIKELQLSIDTDHRGRIMALWAVAFLGVRPLSSLADGALASASSPRLSALVMILPALAVVGVLVVRGRSEPGRELAPVEAGLAGAGPTARESGPTGDPTNR